MVNQTQGLVPFIGVCGIRILSKEEWRLRLGERGLNFSLVSLISLKMEFELEVQLGLLKI